MVVDDVGGHARGPGRAAKRRRAGVQVPASSEPGCKEDEDEENDHDYQLPGDVEAAIMFLRQECLAAAATTAARKPGAALPPPVVLLTQLSSILRDKQAMEREVEDLKQRNVLRLLKLPTGADEHGVILTQDYVQLVRQAAAATSAAPAPSPGAADAPSGSSEAPPALEAVVHALCDRVLPHHTDVAITYVRLAQLMSLPAPTGPGSRECFGAVGSPQQQVVALLQLGILARHPQDDHALLFCCPGVGGLVKSVLAGRKELMAIIGKKQHAEIPERVLVGRGLGRSLQPISNAAAWRGEGGFLRTPDLSDLPGALSRARQQGPGGGIHRSARVVVPQPAAASPGVKLRHSVLGVAFHLRDLLGRGDVQYSQCSLRTGPAASPQDASYQASGCLTIILRLDLATAAPEAETAMQHHAHSVWHNHTRVWHTVRRRDVVAAPRQGPSRPHSRAALDDTIQAPLMAEWHQLVTQLEAVVKERHVPHRGARIKAIRADMQRVMDKLPPSASAQLEAQLIQGRAAASRQRAARLAAAFTSGPHVVIDCGFAAEHCRPGLETRSLVKQVEWAMAVNRRADMPVALHCTGWVGDVARFGQHIGCASWPVRLHAARLLDVFPPAPTQPVIVLSPDAAEPLIDLSPGAVYVVGGIVDRSVRKGVTATFAAQHGLRCMRLPTAEHAQQLGLHPQLGVSTCPVLNVSDAAIALIQFHQPACRDWARALDKAIPERKRRPPLLKAKCTRAQTRWRPELLSSSVDASSPLKPPQINDV